MVKKIIVTVLISLFILLSLVLYPTYYAKSTTIGANSINTLNREDPVEYWGVFLHHGYGDYSPDLRMYEVMCKNGFQEDHIKLVFDDNLTWNELIDAIDWLDKREDSNDICFIQLDCHGGIGIFSLKDGHKHYEDLNIEINKLESEGIFILLNPCYAGSALPILEKKGRIIISKCASNETNSGIGQSERHGLDGIADYVGDNNGIVTAEELFEYMCMIASDQNPQMSDNYPGDLKLLTIDNEQRRVDQKQVLYDYELFPYVLGNKRTYIAQSFVPNSTKLTKVKLIINTGKDRDFDFKLEIKKDLNGLKLTTTSINLSNIPVHNRVLIEFDFPDINVITGEKYYIVCHCPNAPDNAWVWLRTMSEDVYSNGKLFVSENSGESWSDNIEDSMNPDKKHKELFFITYDDKAFLIDAEIIKPKNALYIKNNTIISFFKPVIIGDIDIEINANEHKAVKYIELYIDGKLRENGTLGPNQSNFIWLWERDSLIRHRHTIKVIAYDAEGKSATDEIDVLRFF